jgi:poly-gamma-glutamate capsule biosynthesis protein CapA/YwtB (metallophosphatase superfamily)
LLVTSTTVPGAPFRWTLLFGGDTLLTRRIATQTDPFRNIKPSLSSADLAIVNLETAVTTRGVAQQKTFVFRSAPSFANRLKTAGIDVVSLANNHTLDYGPVGFIDTLDALHEANVRAVGAGETDGDAYQPVFIGIPASDQRSNAQTGEQPNKQGRTICVAVVAASQIIPAATWLAGPSRPGVASAGKHTVNKETQRLLTTVRAANEQADVVVVVMHWGIEGSPCPSPVQRRLGALLRDAGATAVLGAHPHVLQPIVSGPTAKGPRAGEKSLLAYSMGNFIWDPRSGATGDTGVLQLDFEESALQGFTFHPHRLDGNGWASSVDAKSAQGKRITQRTKATC